MFKDLIIIFITCCLCIILIESNLIKNFQYFSIPFNSNIQKLNELKFKIPELNVVNNKYHYYTELKFIFMPYENDKIIIYTEIWIDNGNNMFNLIYSNEIDVTDKDDKEIRKLMKIENEKCKLFIKNYK